MYMTIVVKNLELDYELVCGAPAMYKGLRMQSYIFHYRK